MYTHFELESCLCNGTWSHGLLWHKNKVGSRPWLDEYNRWWDSDTPDYKYWLCVWSSFLDCKKSCCGIDGSLPLCCLSTIKSISDVYQVSSIKTSIVLTRAWSFHVILQMAQYCQSKVWFRQVFPNGILKLHIEHGIKQKNVLSFSLLNTALNWLHRLTKMSLKKRKEKKNLFNSWHNTNPEGLGGGSLALPSSTHADKK